MPPNDRPINGADALKRVINGIAYSISFFVVNCCVVCNTTTVDPDEKNKLLMREVDALKGSVQKLTTQLVSVLLKTRHKHLPRLTLTAQQDDANRKLAMYQKKETKSKPDEAK